MRKSNLVVIITVFKDVPSSSTVDIFNKTFFYDGKMAKYIASRNFQGSKGTFYVVRKNLHGDIPFCMVIYILRLIFFNNIILSRGGN